MGRFADVELVCPACRRALVRPPRDHLFSQRGDEPFELADAVLCADGPVRTLAGLSLTPEQRRGHGALYDVVNCGRVEIGRLRRSLQAAAAAGGRLMLAAAVSNWLRPGRRRTFGSPVTGLSA